MASYLSYFTSNSSSAPTQQQYSQAQPATSTWGSTFTQGIATFRKALTKDSEVDDPNDENCSHVSNVLRAYYTEKDGKLPDWLPADPTKPQALPPAQPQYNPYGQQPNNYPNQYGQSTHSRGPSAGGGPLDDLWEPKPAPPPQRQVPQSLRAQRPQAQTNRSYESNNRPRTNDGYPPPSNVSSYSNRPLPSQQGASFQNTTVTSPPVGSRKTDRVLAKLKPGGSGRNSPAANQSTSNPYGDSGYSAPAGDAGGAPYTSASQPWSSTGGDYDNYSSGGNYGSYGNTAYRQRPSGQR